MTTSFCPFLPAILKWSTSPFAPNFADTPPGTGSGVAFAGSLFGSASTTCCSAVTRTGTGHPLGPVARFGATFTAATPAGAFTATAGISSAPGPAKPTFVSVPCCTASGNAVVAPGKSPMRRR